MARAVLQQLPVKKQSMLWASVHDRQCPVLRGSGNTFWHPPMMPQAESSPHLFHPPMLPPSEESPMDYLHPPMVLQDDESLFSTYLHPPMAIPNDNSQMNGAQQHNMYNNDDNGSHDSYENNMRVY
jgi:hypothetical protein